MAKFSVIHKDGGWYPITPHDLEISNKYPAGLIDVIDITGKRNVLLFRKFWSICRMIYDNDKGGKFRDIHHVKDNLLILAGYVDQCWLMDGNFYLRPHSVSFESCSDEKFKEIWTKILPHVMNFLGVTEEEINDNLIFYV